MDPEQQREEALLMDIIANNHGSNNLLNEQDQCEADNYLNMTWFSHMCRS
jgi:hypothetical protein